MFIKHSQLIKWIKLKFNSSSIALLTRCIYKCCHNRVLYWVYTDPYGFIYWAIRENLAPAARPIQRINSSNIALPFMNPGHKCFIISLINMEMTGMGWKLVELVGNVWKCPYIGWKLLKMASNVSKWHVCWWKWLDITLYR